jgi:hypothetical protein
VIPTILIGITIFLGVVCIGIILRKYCNRRGYMHLRLKLTVFEETTIAIFWACIVKYISLSKEFESILTLLKKKKC